MGAKFNLETTKDIENKIINAMNGAEPIEFAKLQSEIIENLRNEIEDLRNANVDFYNDAEMTAHGFTKLTGEEKKFYNAVVERTGELKDGEELDLPETIVLRVFDEIQDESPILGKIDMQHTMGAMKIIFTKAGVDIATWDNITAEIEPQLTFSIETLDLSEYKLKAFMNVPLDLLEPSVGYYWLDRYIVQFLARGMRRGIEKAVIQGTGVKQPIGLIRNVEGSRTDGQPYPELTTVALKELSPLELGKVEATLTEKTEGAVTIALNPTDYKIVWRPLLAYQTPNGQWNYNTLPINADVVTSEFIEKGKAIAFRGDKYHFGYSLPTKIEKTDKYRFLEDDMTYKAKMFANGRPEDGQTAVYLDISGLGATEPTV